jgi:hypothetical protein
MARQARVMGASIALFILTMGGLFTLYQVIFDIWMTAYPFANTNEWRTRLYIRLATIILIGLIWSTWSARSFVPSSLLV